MAEQYKVPPYPYCPWCAAPLPQEEPYRQECARCGFVLYHASSPCMGAIPVDARGHVLLARRGIEPFHGDWNTIGGFLDYGEEPLDGLKREVREETGAECRVLEFITANSETYGRGGPALINTYFTVELLSGDYRPQDDVSELKWFSLDALPQNIAFQSDCRALAELKKMRAQPAAAKTDPG